MRFIIVCIQQELEEYRNEGVPLSDVTFVDNQQTLDLLLSRKLSVFSVLEEECRMPRADDLSFVQKMTSSLKSHPSNSFEPARSDKDLHFSVTHYAGKV